MKNFKLTECVTKALFIGAGRISQYVQKWMEDRFDPEILTVVIGTDIDFRRVPGQYELPISHEARCRESYYRLRNSRKDWLSVLLKPSNLTTISVYHPVLLHPKQMKLSG